MKIKKCVFLLCKIVIAFLALAGCAVFVPTAQQPDITPSLTATLASNPTATRTITSPQDLYTPVPTISSDELEHMLALLQSNDCKLPCYLGITPGKTTLNEAKAILVSLGGTHVSDYKRKDGATEYFYNLWVGDPTAANDTPEPNGAMTKIIHHVSLITNNDTVQIIEVYINATKSIEKFREYWSRYTAKEIFLQMGPPDQLYADVIDPQWPPNGRTLFMVYEKRGAVVELYGTRQENNICPPDSEAHFINLSLSLYNPNSTLSIYSNGRTSQDLGTPIEEVVGVNTLAFYNRVLSDPSACFQVK